MKKLLASLLVALCGAASLFAGESKSEMQRTCTECDFIVKNKLTGGRLVCRIDDNSKRRIKIILRKGYFTQDLGVRDIKVTRGHIEFRGRNGSLIFYPGEEFCFIAKLPDATICSEKFKFDSYSGFFMSQYPRYKEKPLHVARFDSGQMLDFHEHEFAKRGMPPEFGIDFALSFQDDCSIVLIECIPSPDFMGSAEIRVMGNLYNDTGGVEWIWRMFHNPAK